MMYKGRCILAFLLVLAFAATASGQSLRVFSNQSGARVYVDDSLVGHTPESPKDPLIVEQLGPGSHTIRVVKDGFPEFKEMVNIAIGRPASVEAVLRRLPTEGRLTVIFRYTGSASDRPRWIQASADPGGSRCRWWFSGGKGGEGNGGYWAGWSYKVVDNECIYERDFPVGRARVTLLVDMISVDETDGRERMRRSLERSGGDNFGEQLKAQAEYVRGLISSRERGLVAQQVKVYDDGYFDVSGGADTTIVVSFGDSTYTIECTSSSQCGPFQPLGRR